MGGVWEAGMGSTPVFECWVMLIRLFGNRLSESDMLLAGFESCVVAYDPPKAKAATGRKLRRCMGVTPK